MLNKQYHSSYRTSVLNKLYNREPSIDLAVLNKIYIGRVRDTRDPQKMGRLLVWVPELARTADDPDSWFVASYCSPFAGASYLDVNMYNDIEGKTDAVDSQRNKTDKLRQPSNIKDELGGRQSYGMWFTPPDIGNEIIVTFVRGDATSCIWLGSLFPQFQNHMVPGIASAIAEKTKQTNNTDDKTGPVLESDLRNVQNPQDINNPRKKYAPLFNGLKKQGLNKDKSRGVTTSSAQRESPSQVFGILSPGGNQFVMDDGTRNYVDDSSHPGGDEYIRLRTKSGTQLLLNETTGSIYAISRDGLTWLELGNDGNIDIYGKSNISIHAESGDINMRTSGKTGDINIQSSRDINMNAARHMRIFTGSEIDIISTNNFTLFSGKKTSIISIDNMGIEVRKIGSKLGISVASDINIQTPGGSFTAISALDMLLKSDNKIGIIAGANMSIKAPGSIGIEAGSQFAIAALKELTITSTTKDIGIATILGNTSITSGKKIQLKSIVGMSVVTPAVTFNSASVGISGNLVAATVSGVSIKATTLHGATINGGIVGAVAFKGPFPVGAGSPPTPPLPPAVIPPSLPPIALGAPTPPTTPIAGPIAIEAQGSPIHDGVTGITISTDGDNGPWKSGKPYKSNTNIIPRVPQHEPWKARNTKDASATNNIVMETNTAAKLGSHLPNASKPNNIIKDNGEVLIGTGYDSNHKPTYIVNVALSNAALTKNPSQLVVSDETKNMIKSFETPLANVTLNAANEKTIGFGHKITTKEDIAGTFNGVILTETQQLSLFNQDLKKSEASIRKHITNKVTQGQFDALASLHMNIGEHNFSVSSIVKTINAKELFKIPTLLSRWASIRLPSLPSLSSLLSLPPLPSLPSLPSLPNIPSLPSLPNIPSLPALPNVPTLSKIESTINLPSAISLPSSLKIPALPNNVNNIIGGSRIIKLPGLENRRSIEASLFSKIPGQDSATTIVKTVI